MTYQTIGSFSFEPKGVDEIFAIDMSLLTIVVSIEGTVEFVCLLKPSEMLVTQEKEASLPVEDSTNALMIRSHS